MWIDLEIFIKQRNRVSFIVIVIEKYCSCSLTLIRHHILHFENYCFILEHFPSYIFYKQHYFKWPTIYFDINSLSSSVMCWYYFFQIHPYPGPPKYSRAWYGSKLFDTLAVLLKDFFIKLFLIKFARRQKSLQLTQ